MVTVYGLRNCDACRRALKGLVGTEHRFHDLRADGLEPALLSRWIRELGWEALLNRRSTTWRGLAEDDRSGLDAAKAEALMLAHPTLVKRPVIDDGETVRIGLR